MDRICVLLPAYNEAERIEAVIRGVRVPDAAVEVVVVDDGSFDETRRVAARAGARVITLGRNLGVGAALARGLALGRDEGFDYLVHIDADGQIDPAQIPAVLAPVREGRADAAIGSRFLAGRPAYLTPLKSFLLSLLAGAVGVAVDAPLTDLSCGIRALNRAALAAARPRFGSDYIQETLLQFFGAGLRVVEVPVEARGRDGARGLSGRALSYTTRYLFLLAWALGGFYVARLRRLLSPAPAPALAGR